MNKNKQKGFDSKGWTGFLICLMLISAFIGWVLLKGCFGWYHILLWGGFDE